MPKVGLPVLKTFGQECVPLVVVRVAIEATTAAKARLKVGDAAGQRVLTVAVALKERKAPLRLEIEDAPASAGARFAGGK